jgi:hypothetical protein
MKTKMLIALAIVACAYVAWPRKSVKASGSVKVYRVEAKDNLGDQEFIPLGSSMRTQARSLDPSDVIAFSCTSSKDGDNCYVLAK